jgi:hypothetical protein
MVTTIYCLAVLLFCAAFYSTSPVATCRQLISTAQIAVRTIVDQNLDDAAKEKATQVAAINMLKNSFFLLIKLTITLGVALLPLWLADVAGFADLSSTIEFSLRIDVLIITTIVVTAIVFFGRQFISKQ